MITRIVRLECDAKCSKVEEVEGDSSNNPVVIPSGWFRTQGRFQFGDQIVCSRECLTVIIRLEKARYEKWMTDVMYSEYDKQNPT